MSDPKKTLDKLLRRQRLRHLLVVFLVPGAVLLGLTGWFYTQTAPRDPLGRTFILAEVVQVDDITSGTGVGFEVTARFGDLQKAFRTDDPAIIAALGETVCIMQTRGMTIGEGVPAPRYHRLVALKNCTIPDM